jgi:hypothetical protein
VLRALGWRRTWRTPASGMCVGEGGGSRGGQGGGGARSGGGGELWDGDTALVTFFDKGGTWHTPASGEHMGAEECVPSGGVLVSTLACMSW